MSGSWRSPTATSALRRIAHCAASPSTGPSSDDRYLLRIPVLVVGEAELDVAGLEDAAIVRWLREVAAG